MAVTTMNKKREFRKKIMYRTKLMISAAFDNGFLENLGLICINLPKKFDFTSTKRLRVVA